MRRYWMAAARGVPDLLSGHGRPVSEINDRFGGYSGKCRYRGAQAGLRSVGEVGRVCLMWRFVFF
ncbi:hypothetical protein SAMN06265355_11597 [Actinomadura mexicana]|uniref:Uncharacterized protein n=1 Tax=Actinomadura mexicana TaxID=134959 RepID=A0A239DRV7_9ACTN|nr:hypothetical protein SAMN06265355_11597 [Actinomadura mexicana]